MPGYLGIMVTRHVQFCCIFAATKDKLDYFLKKLFHSSTLHTYHYNSSWFLSKHKNIYVGNGFELKYMINQFHEFSKSNFQRIFALWPNMQCVVGA